MGVASRMVSGQARPLIVTRRLAPIRRARPMQGATEANGLANATFRGYYPLALRILYTGYGWADSPAFMWTCPKCKEQIGDEFNSCWKCAGTADSTPSPQKIKKPLEQFESICILMAILPGFIFFTRGSCSQS